jgi:hypothetical protein
MVGRLVVETELSRHRAFAPVSIAPDISVGVGDRLALSLHYSSASQAMLGAGNGVCITAPRETLDAHDSMCSESETGLGLGLLSELTDRSVLRAGALVRGPGELALALGIASTLRRGRWWLVTAPTVFIGVTGRDRGNRERLLAPIYGGVSVGAGEVHLRTGIEGAVATFDETLAIPIGAGASFSIGAVRVGADVTLDRALGPASGRAWRSASIYVATTLGGAR